MLLFTKGLLSDGEFHENWHSKSPALLTVLQIMPLGVFEYHENLCRESILSPWAYMKLHLHMYREDDTLKAKNALVKAVRSGLHYLQFC
jgi:hypothetical protein